MGRESDQATGLGPAADLGEEVDGLAVGPLLHIAILGAYWRQRLMPIGQTLDIPSSSDALC